jgi:penicillin-binding protein 1A
MCFSPSLVTGTWVGGEERSIAFDRMAYGQGASMALPVFAKFIQKVYADPTLPYNEGEQFVYPDNYDPCHPSAIVSGHELQPMQQQEGEAGVFD